MIAGSASAADSKVSGRVTLEGKPLAAGKITFYLADGEFFGSKVKDGKYAIDHAQAGTRKVTVEGEGVPIKYTLDDTSSLTVEIKDGKNVFDLDLR
jgi:hypothetical protein